MSEKISCGDALSAGRATETSFNLSSTGPVPSRWTRKVVPISAKNVSCFNASMLMSFGFLARVANVFQRRRSESLGQLGEVKTLRRHRPARRIENSFRQIRLRIKWPGRADALADAANGPIAGSRRILNQKGFRHAIPRHRPAQAPTMPRSHRAAIFEINTAARRLTVVEQEPRGPALVSFDVSVAAEVALEQNNRSGMSAARGDKPDVVAGHRAAMQIGRAHV